MYLSFNMTSKFGERLKAEFGLDPNYTYLNHATYGQTPKVVREERLRLLNEMETCPEMWFQVKRHQYWDEHIEAAAQFLHAKPENLVFVQNATTGLNCVLKSLGLNPGEAIMTYSWQHTAIKNACLMTARMTGCEVVTAKVKLPINSKDDIIEMYRGELDQHPNIKVAVLGGGSGFIGRHLTELLVRKGHVVHWISRNPGKAKVPKCISWNDLAKDGLPEGYNAVVNLSGENLMNPLKRWNDDLKKSLLSSRVDTTQTLVEAVRQAKQKPEVFIGSSGVSFYKPDPDKEYTELSPREDFDFLAELAHKWEDATQPLEGSEVRRVTVRIGLVLGRDGGVIQNMYLPFFLGLGGPIGSGKQWFPWIHARDIAGIIAYAIENKNVTGVLNGVAPQHITNVEFTRAFARAMNRPAFFWVPNFAINMVYGEERAVAMLNGQKVTPKRTLEAGYKFEYPDIDSACKEFARWW